MAVDRAFFERLKTILGICVPSWRSKEAGLVLVQGLLLVSRTVLSEKISEIEGRGATNIISQQFHKFAGTMLDFALLTAPAALVNSGLKWFQKLIELAFRDRLTRKLHDLYLGGRCYYLASSLGGLSHADQRITEDVEKFSFAVSELYSYTFKPLLDVLLFSQSLTRTMGYKYQAVLYGYYALVAVALKATSPPISLLVAQESALTAGFRTAHHRIVNKAEEIAYNDPPGGATELLILNHHLSGQLQHAALTSYQRFLQRFADQYLVKYGASLLGLFAYAAPVYFTVSDTRTRTRQAPTLPFPPNHGSAPVTDTRNDSRSPRGKTATSTRRSTSGASGCCRTRARASGTSSSPTSVWRRSPATRRGWPSCWRASRPSRPRAGRGRPSSGTACTSCRRAPPQSRSSGRAGRSASRIARCTTPTGRCWCAS